MDDTVQSTSTAANVRTNSGEMSSTDEAETQTRRNTTMPRVSLQDLDRR